MKIELELIPPSSNQSFTVFHHDTSNPCPVQWHYHPEYELLYLPKGTGRRHIGHNISRYEDGELLLLGPNIPHLSYGYGQGETFEETGVQFPEYLLGSGLLALPEMERVRRLLERACTGLVFAAPLRHQIGQQLQALRMLPPWECLLALLNILQQLALTENCTDLVVGNPAKVSPAARERLNRVLKLLELRLGVVSVPELAAEAALSLPAFCRFFKKMTQRTVTEFINECRVQRACQLLWQNISITEVGYTCGFQNLSHFNHTFRRLIGVNPSTYRRTAPKPTNVPT